MEEKEIRFIDPHYRELFRIKDGEKIIITTERGERLERECHYIDDYHTKAGNYLYHICEFAECMQRNGNTYEPKEKQEREEGKKQGRERKSEKNRLEPKSKNKERER